MSVLVTQSLSFFPMLSSSWPWLAVWDCYLVLIAFFVPGPVSILVRDLGIKQYFPSFAVH